MATDPLGRWFRVYARQVRQHEKFRDLTAEELGTWMTLRSEAELRDGGVIVDRDEALLILRRRKVADPDATLDRLIALRLFDVGTDGSITVHDKADFDRPRFPSDEPEQVKERVQKHRSIRAQSVTNGNDSLQKGNEPHAGARGLHASSVSNSASKSVVPRAREDELPAEDDSATLACRMLPDGGRWLGDGEYVAAWDDMDHRFSAEWVQAEIQPAYAELVSTGKVRAWDMKKAVELRCAERMRAEERQRTDATQRQAEEETAGARRRASEMTAEERERQSLFRKATGLWLHGGRRGKVPGDVDGLRSWVAANGGSA